MKVNKALTQVQDLDTVVLTFHACNFETAERICELLELKGRITDYVLLYEAPCAS